MTSLDCSRCGAMNMPTEQTCFKCGSPLHVTTRIQTAQEPYFPHPTYGMAHIWRDRSILVMTKDALLPQRCIKCNAPSAENLKRKLQWHHPALYLLVLVSILVYIIVAFVVRKSATVNVGLCQEHLSSRRQSIVITLLLVGIAMLSSVAAVQFEAPLLFLVALGLVLAAAVYGTMTIRVVAPTKIDDHYVWIKGVNADYLQEFPEWQGVRS